MKALVLVGVALLVVVAACSSGQASESTRDPQIVAGAEVYGQSCEVCHGRRGAGGSAPAFTAELLADFPSCEDHIRWVTIGSDQWREEVGNEVGASGREITGVMPPFESLRTAEEIRQVVLYERVELAGADLSAELAACPGS